MVVVCDCFVWVLYDTLLKQVDLPELLAILGHEIGHWKVR